MTLSESDLSLGYAASGITVADLSGNGTEDLLVSDANAGKVRIYMQTAAGAWIPGQVIPVGKHPTAIITEDLNRDGLIDIAVLNAFDGTVSTLLQDPSNAGRFSPDSDPVHVGAAPFSMVSADFNQDGLQDLAVTNFADNTVSVLINQERQPGRFSLGSLLQTQNGPSGIAAASLIGNEQIDLAVTNFYDGTVSVFVGMPETPSLFRALPNVDRVGAGPRGIVACDIDGDGLLDLVVTNSLDGTLSIMPATAGQPGQFPTQVIVDGFSEPVSLTVINRLGDAKPPDLIATDAATGDLTILQNDGSGVFAQRSLFPAGASPSQVSKIYSETSGSFSVAVMDPSLQIIHIIKRAWEEDGYLSPTATIDRNVPHQVQARLDNLDSTLVSNIISTEAPSKKQQVISFPQMGPFLYGVEPLTLTAKATSGLPIRFRLVSGGAGIQDSSLSILWAGAIEVEAIQDGDLKFEPAPPVDQTIYVFKNNLTIVPNAAQRVFGVENPTFTGNLIGYAPGRNPIPVYHSDAGGKTPIGAYADFPIGVGATINDPFVLPNYYVFSRIGTLTICPSTSVSQASIPAHVLAHESIINNSSSVTGCSESLAGSSTEHKLPPTRIGSSAPPATVTTQPISTLPAPPSPVSGVPVTITSPIIGTPLLPVPVASSPDSPGSAPTQVGGPVSTSPQPPTQSPTGGLPAPGSPPVPVATPPDSPGSAPTQAGGPVSTSTQPPTQSPTGGLPTPGRPPSFPVPFSPVLPPIRTSIGGLGVLPLPIPLPFRRKISASNDIRHSSSLVIIPDESAARIFGWAAVKILLSCQVADPRPRRIRIVASGKETDLDVQAGKTTATRISILVYHDVKLTAQFAGDELCSAADSPELTLQPAPLYDSPASQMNLNGWLQIQPFEKWHFDPIEVDREVQSDQIRQQHVPWDGVECGEPFSGGEYDVIEKILETNPTP
jgi:hypothetical protein